MNEKVYEQYSRDGADQDPELISLINTNVCGVNRDVRI